MGQEILYCNKCGKKLLGDDFTRGRAHTFNNRQYCSKCLPQHITSGMQAIKDDETKSSKKSDRSTRVRVKPATTRAVPPAPKPRAPLFIGVALAMAAAVVILIVTSSKSEDPSPTPAALPAKPETARLDPAQTARQKERIAQELKELEGKVQSIVKKEQFAAAIDLMDEARKRYDAPEWDRSIASRIKEVREIPTRLYPTLKEQARGSQMRNAVAEVLQVRTRIAGWGRKDLLDDLDRALSAVVPHEPLPPGAVVLVRFPNGDPTKYRTLGDLRDGSMAAQRRKDHVMAGWESGLEIFKVPAEGEIRLTYSTSSPALVTVICRAFAADGKSHSYNWWEKQPQVGRPQLLKFPITRLQDWNKSPILVGGKVDNVYVRQDDASAVFIVHEFVIFKTKD